MLLVALAVSGCATTIQARVLDAETKQPIPGAVVQGIWTKIAGVRGFTHHELVGSQETETDADGRFTLRRLPSDGFEDDGESILIYKFGYVAWNNLRMFPSRARRERQGVPKEILLDRFPQSGSHFEHLLFVGSLDFPGATRSILLRALEPEDDLARRERR
jgi:hypothetical protein